MRIWRCVLFLAFVLVCAAGWGLSPAAREKILQLKEKYRHENAAAGSTDFRETARQLREKLQRQTDKKLPAEAVDTTAFTPAAVAREPQTGLLPAGETPQTTKQPPAETALVGPQNPNRPPGLLAEKYDHMPAEPETERAGGQRAYSPQQSGTANQRHGFGEFIVVFVVLIVLASLTGNLAGLVRPGGGGVQEFLLLACGGALLLAIGVLVVEIWTNFMPFLLILGFCMLWPKGLEKSLGEGLGCLVTLAIVIFAMPFIIGGDLLLLLVCPVLFFLFSGRR